MQGIRGNINSLEKYDLFTGKNNSKNKNPYSGRKERNSLLHYQQRHTGVKCRDLGPHVIFGDGKSRKSRSQEPLYAAKKMLLHLYLPVCCLSKFCHHLSSSCFFPSFTPTALLSPHPSLFLLPITACLSTLWRVFSSVWLKSKTSKSPQGVLIQTRSLAASLPLLSDSLLPPLILACLLPKATSSGFILLCFNVMTSSLFLSALNPVCD